jgi:hypothetical protein
LTSIACNTEGGIIGALITIAWALCRDAKLINTQDCIYLKGYIVYI